MATGYSGNVTIWKGRGSDRPETVPTSRDIAGDGKRKIAATTKRKKQSVGPLVGGWEGAEGPQRNTRQLVNDNGRHQTAQDGQNYEGTGPQGFRKKRMDAMRQKIGLRLARKSTSR